MTSSSSTMPKRLDLAASVTSPRDARLFVAHWARSWGYPRIINAAVLVTSELATNAVVHGSDAFSVVVSNTGRGIRVDVQDDAEGVPVLRPLPEIDEGGAGGRGLHVVDALASRWGYERDETSSSKQVWFELDADSDAAFGWSAGG